MKRKFLAFLLAFVMVVGMLPMAALAEENVDAVQTETDPAAPTQDDSVDGQTDTGDTNTGDTNTSDTGTGTGDTNATTTFSLEGSKVEEITKTATITGSGTADVKIEVNPASKLVWYPANNTIGRSYAGWWIGINVTAPTALAADKAVYYKNGVSDSQKFSEHKDGDNYMQLWGGIPDTNFLDPVFKATGGKYTLTYTWYFNWDGESTTGKSITFKGAGNQDANAEGIDQVVTLTFNLENCQLLAKPTDTSKPGSGSEAQIWPRAVNFSITNKDNKTTYYEKLTDAVANAASESTITMLQDVEGPGVKLAASANKTLTIDFGGHIYTCADPAAGSTGTESQGFHLEKGNTVTLKNGTIAVKEGVNDTRTLIQNYSNLTLDSITLDGTNLHEALYKGVVFPQKATFTLNSYNGEVSLTNVTINKSKNSTTAYAIGCGWWPGTSNANYNWYPNGTKITVDDKSTFENVLLYRDDASQTTSNVSDANSTIKLNGTTYALKYEDTTSPYYVEFTKSGDKLTPVLPAATVNYTALADKTIVADCADKTMWVQFDEAVPSNTWLWFKITNGTYTYGIAGTPDKTKTKFAWSFTNKGQFEMWPEAVTEVASGEYTVTCYVLPGSVSGTQTAVPTGAWELWSKTVNVADLTPATAAPVVTLDESLKALTEDQKKAVTDAAANVALSDTTMDTLSSTAYNAVANSNNPPTAEQGKKVLTEKGITVNNGDTVNLVVQTYMDVAVTEYIPATGDTPATLTYDITPMYRVVATTETDTSKIAVAGETNGTANAAIVVEGQKLTVGHRVEVTVGLPTGFVEKDATTSRYPNVYVQHKGHEYTATVAEGSATGSGDNPLLATFTNPHGFSTFTITATSTAVANIGGDSYTSLQDAVNAVENNGTITLQKDCAENVTVSRAVVFTLDSSSHKFTGTITAGSDYTLTVVGSKYTVTKKSSGGGDNPGGGNNPSGGGSYGGGGGGGSSYTVSVPSSVPNGTVKVSPTSASEGSRVTITATPAAGYEVGSVIVTDKDGNEIAVTDAGNGKYTFIMPKGKVDVKVEFVAKQTEDTGRFVDVDSSAWYADAVNWAVEKGITAGTSATTFSPNAPCTRAQVVTFLWRAAGSPEATGSNPFTDVAEGSYYYDAVLWAVEKGITVGTSATTFSPDTVCTRAQIVTFLWRYEDSPAATGSSSFTDVAPGDWFYSAVNWAVSEGVTAGTGANAFSPNADCTRAQTVTFLYRDMA